MQNNKVVKGLCNLIRWVRSIKNAICNIYQKYQTYRTYRIYREYQAYLKDKKLYKGFKKYCDLKLAQIKSDGVTIDPEHEPQIVDGIFYIVGKYPSGDRYYHEYSFKTFKEAKQRINGRARTNKRRE